MLAEYPEGRGAVARDLYRAAENLEGACHLSALMYPAHRAARLGEITAALKAEGTNGDARANGRYRSHVNLMTQ